MLRCLLTKTIMWISVAVLLVACSKREFRDMVRDGDLSGCKKALQSMPALANTPDSSGTPPLLLAAGNGHAAVVDLLLKNGANPNSTEPFLQTTPLHWACYKGHVDIAELLLRAGANINAHDKAGRAPYDMASDAAQTATMELLSMRGGRSAEAHQ